MGIKRNLLLICLSAFCITNNAIAVSPHDEKTCIEGTDFDIKRVRKLVVEGKEVPWYGKWESKTFTMSGPEIASSYRDWFYQVFLKKYRPAKRTKRRTVYSLHIRQTENIENQLRRIIADRTGMRLDNLSQEISIPYRGEGALTDAWSREVRHWRRYVIGYSFRPDQPKFVVTNEYFEIFNPRAQKVIESVCRPKRTICLDSKDRVFLGKYPLKRQCWSEEITYNCKTEPQNGCQHLIDQGYHLYKSACLDKQEDLCLKWKRYYIKAKAGAGERYADDEDESYSSKFGSGGSGFGFNEYDGSSEDEDLNSDRYALDQQNGSKRIFDFPRRNHSKGANSDNGRNSRTDLRNKNASDTDDAAKDARGSNASSGNGKNSGFQKYQSIKTKGTSSSGGGVGGGGGSKNGNGGEHDAVIVHSIQIDPDFLIQEGTYIPCSLTMRFVSEVAGRIQCLINQDVYGTSGRVKLIERGTKAIGVYQSSTLGYGMARMHVIWTKLLTPDYKRVNLVDTQVVGRLGEAGIDGRVNSHFAQRFGGALMVSLIKDVVAGVSEKHSGKTRKNTININTFENTKDSTTAIVERMLDDSINIPPTMYKKQGDIIGIEVGKDIDFSKIYKMRVKNTR